MTGEKVAVEPIRLEFSWAPNDFVEANSLYLKHDRAGRIRQYLICAPAIGVLFWRISVDYPGLSIPGRFSISVLGLLLAIWFIGLFARGIHWFQKRMQADTVSNEPLANKPIAYTVTEDYIEMVTPDTESKTKWSHFDRWLENENMLLALSGRLMYRFPKSKLDDDSEVVIRQLLEDKIGPHGKRRPKAKSS